MALTLLRLRSCTKCTIMPCVYVINLSHNQKNFKKYGGAYEEACNIYIDIHFTSVVEKSSFAEIERGVDT